MNSFGSANDLDQMELLEKELATQQANILKKIKLAK